MLIIIFLENCFKLYYCSKIIYPDALKINNVLYLKDENSKESSGFTGFFDWLRLNESDIVGIRLCYFEDQPYSQILLKFPYASPTLDNKCFEILFKGDSYNADISGDQDFTNNYIYVSEELSYLFTFGMDHLTKDETMSLLKYCEVINEMEITEIFG